ncbi:hypothetical protein DMENIID0001_093070 [Sergentomyia squamirostris]
MDANGDGVVTPSAGDGAAASASASCLNGTVRKSPAPSSTCNSVHFQDPPDFQPPRRHSVSYSNGHQSRHNQVRRAQTPQYQLLTPQRLQAPDSPSLVRVRAWYTSEKQGILQNSSANAGFCH